MYIPGQRDVYWPLCRLPTWQASLCGDLGRGGLQVTAFLAHCCLFTDTAGFNQSVLPLASEHPPPSPLM